MTLVKEHILLIIHMEGVRWVPLIKFYTKALFLVDTELFYILSYTNQYFLTL